ncbi:hypothetical protein [Alkalispirochaeta americana]|nr:hypothetical protein [Alkalispirochaeta americana]
MNDFEEDLENLEDYCEEQDRAYLDRLEEEFFQPPSDQGAPMEEKKSPFGELEDLDEIGEG